jgi:hypothetical protein
MCDDNRPVITIASPQLGDRRIDRIVFGLHDYYTGLDMDSLRVEASVAIDGVPAGENLFEKLNFKQTSQGVWALALKKPIEPSTASDLTVSVKDQQGNLARVQRSLKPPRRGDAEP